MTLQERAQALAAAAEPFPWLGRYTAEDLIGWVRSELGDELALETFRPMGKRFCRARPPASTLHIVSGNTPHAALQSLTRGLLLGGVHWVKLPSEGLPEVIDFVSSLPKEMRESIQVETTIPKEWWENADLVVAFGADEALAEIHAKLRYDQRFLPHGPKLSFGFVFGGQYDQASTAAAEDVSVFDQMGCLSPVAFYVRENPLRFAESLAQAMGEYDAVHPRRAIPPAVAAQIRRMRTEHAFRESNGEGCRVLASSGSTNWTVVFLPSAQAPDSPLHRFVYVMPMPEYLPQFFQRHSRYLSCAGVWPAQPAAASLLADAGFRRICLLGQMQRPPLTWRHDGFAPLASRISWVEFEQ